MVLSRKRTNARAIDDADERTPRTCGLNFCIMVWIGCGYPLNIFFDSPSHSSPTSSCFVNALASTIGVLYPPTRKTCCLCCSDADDDLVHEYDDYADAYENDERERLLEGEDTALLAAHRQTEARLRASPSTSSASSADCDVHNAEAGAGRGVADPHSAAIDGAGAAAAHPAPAPPPRTLSAVSVDDPDALACPTCLEAYTSENPRINTACGHHYHLSCIYEWSERSDLCPICQRPMQDEHGEPFW